MYLPQGGNKPELSMPCVGDFNARPSTACDFCLAFTERQHATRRVISQPEKEVPVIHFVLLW